MRQKKEEKVSNLTKNLQISHTNWYALRYPVQYQLQQFQKNTNGRESRTWNFATRIAVQSEGNVIHSRFLQVERVGPKP